MITLNELRQKVFRTYAQGTNYPPTGVFEGDGLAQFVWDELGDAFNTGDDPLNEAYRFMHAAKRDIEEVMDTIVKEIKSENEQS